MAFVLSRPIFAATTNIRTTFVRVRIVYKSRDELNLFGEFDYLPAIS